MELAHFSVPIAPTEEPYPLLVRLSEDRHNLYGVQNFLNQIALVDLGADFSQGTISELITDPDFRIPTTVARFGRYLYVVNVCFDTPPTPDTEYEVVRVNK